MLNRKNNKAGFAIVEIMVILAVLALVFVICLQIYHRHRKTNVNRVQTASADPYAGWETYSNKVSEFSVRYPNNWNITGLAPTTGPYAGQFSANTISSIKPEQLFYEDSRPQFKDNLQLFIQFDDTGTTKPTYSKLSSNENILGNIDINGTKYELGASRAKGESSSITTQVELLQCKADDSCTNQIERNNGKYISAKIASVGNQQTLTVPIDFKSTEYATVIKILSSTKF